LVCDVRLPDLRLGEEAPDVTEQVRLAGVGKSRKDSDRKFVGRPALRLWLSIVVSTGDTDRKDGRLERDTDR
jgi:hypothetical protein